MDNKDINSQEYALLVGKALAETDPKKRAAIETLLKIILNSSSEISDAIVGCAETISKISK